jgi:small subunit ribosomal protein S1
LSLSIKRVEGQVLPVRSITAPIDGDAGDLDNVPELGLSEDVFAGEDQPLPADTDGASDAALETESEAEVGAADDQLEAGPDA